MLLQIIMYQNIYLIMLGVIQHIYRDHISCFVSRFKCKKFQFDHRTIYYYIVFHLNFINTLVYIRSHPFFETEQFPIFNFIEIRSQVYSIDFEIDESIIPVQP